MNQLWMSILERFESFSGVLNFQLTVTQVSLDAIKQCSTNSLLNIQKKNLDDSIMLD